MDEAQHYAIKELYEDFQKNLHIDPEFLGPMIQKSVLKDSMIEEIMVTKFPWLTTYMSKQHRFWQDCADVEACLNLCCLHILALPTQSKKIMQFLQFIPRCGENAFDCFLEILGKRSLWLANKLQEKHREKMEQMLQNDVKTGDNLHNDSEMLVEAEDTYNDTELLSDKESTPTQIKLSKPNSAASTLSPSASLRSSAATTLQFKHDLNHLYINLKEKLRSHHKRELSFATPEPATFKMIETLHDELFERLTDLEINTDQCYRALGINNKKDSLLTYIIKLKSGKEELEKQLKDSEDKRNKYCDYIGKLDLKIRDQASEIQIKEEKLRKISKEKENKSEYESKFKNQINELKNELMTREKKQEELEEKLRDWEIKYAQLQQEVPQKRELKDRHPNHNNKNVLEENLQGLLNISQQTKRNQGNSNQDESVSNSPRISRGIKISKTGLEMGRAKLKQPRIHRRQSRYQDYAGLSCLSGSGIFNTNSQYENSMKQQKALEDINEIKQRKQSLNNVYNCPVENPQLSSKQSTSYNPAKITPVSIQKKDGTEFKDSQSEQDPILNRKSHKKQPLLKSLTSRGVGKDNGTTPKNSKMF